MRDSQENLIGSQQSLISQSDCHNPNDILLTPTEKRYLLCCERGDIATVRRLIEELKDRPEELNIDCVDPINRSGLVTAIENENIELVRLLLEKGIKVKDALLHAIREEYVEGVEVLLEWEESIHSPGLPYSWEAVDRSSSSFTPDITPLILASHKNNYEILKILLDRGATLPTPHDVRCGCDECISSSQTDSLRHSQSRINAYRALSSPSLIALSSKDPLLTAFELSWELRRLTFAEAEFREEYKEMRRTTEQFATTLLDHARTSNELEIMLNFDPEGDIWEPGERQTLERLKLAVKYKQKQFVAHPNVQQLLASIWYDGLPGFRRKNMVRQMLEVLKLGCMFPVYSSIYMVAPDSKKGQFMKKPFVKFIFHSFSYAFFLMLLGLASQRAEFLIIEWFGTQWMQEILVEWKRRERGSLPGLVESALVIYIISWIFGEVKSLWNDGLIEYIADLWNIVDFITNCFYMLWICLRMSAFIIVKRDEWNGKDPYYPREQWHPFDPMLLSEGAFAAGMILSFLKLVHIFSVNPHLGPLQISLGRMIIDIIKFFFIYTLVLFAFGCGMNQLLWYYAELEKNKCYVLPDPSIPDFDNNEKACVVWRRFANLFETSQSLFWASFGLVDLLSFDLKGIKSFTRFWALLMFGCYSVMNIIVLLNMLIAMMSNSYQIISERSDVEWKFARSKLWISYFEEGNTLPAPFNLLPNIKLIMRLCGCRREKETTGSFKKKHRTLSLERHDAVMRLLVRRYVVAEQCKRDDYGITEDDVMEIRQDISTLRFELVDIFKTNGMRTPHIDNPESNAVTKKGKVMERRLIKDFQIGMVEGVIADVLKNNKGTTNVFSKIASALGRRSLSGSKKKDWNAIVRRSIKKSNPIGSTEERNVRLNRQSVRRHIIESKESHKSIDPDMLIEYNPKLSEVTPVARIAYAKFKINKIKKEFEQEEEIKNTQGESVKTVTTMPHKTSMLRTDRTDESDMKNNPVETDVKISSETGEQSTHSIRTVTPDPGSNTQLQGSEPSTSISQANILECYTRDVAPPVPENSPIYADSISSSIPEFLLEGTETRDNEVKIVTAGLEGNVASEDIQDKIVTPEKVDLKEEVTIKVEEVQEKDPEKEKKTEEIRKPIVPRKPGGRSVISGEVLTGWI